MKVWDFVPAEITEASYWFSKLKLLCYANLSNNSSTFSSVELQFSWKRGIFPLAKPLSKTVTK